MENTCSRHEGFDRLCESAIVICADTKSSPFCEKHHREFHLEKGSKCRGLQIRFVET